MSPDESRRLLDYARACVEAAARGDAAPPVPRLPALAERRGCFVTLKRGGRLRGCIGRIETDEPLSSTIPAMAAAAALEDPRFSPVSPEECSHLDIEISILTPPRAVADISAVRPGTDGIIVSRGSRRGCYLPQVALETGWNARQLVRSCCSEKAGLPEDAVERGLARIEVFQAEVVSDSEPPGDVKKS